ncbi:ImmA/IrrE family metallo-endopeptidase [Carnobacterium pleistocenium]|uniref:ImmA/IrrE family metallo-endopeptidase n=1 Tax=Carnobacterium pleistocenium TaxID=181073 RepID=UPI00068FF9CB|nr:ImmA/IrrE family metallo-endopeptidase [Carnobacterium pleistocenium]
MEDFVSREANKVVNIHNTSLPSKLAKLCGCEVIYLNLSDDTWGFTVKKSRINTIVINQALEENVQEFVIAHELGHVRLHSGINTPFLRRVAKGSFIPSIEYEANRFAFDVLLSGIDDKELYTKFQLLESLGLPNDLERFF